MSDSKKSKDDDTSKQTIKIAAKSLSKRQQTGADPGPGDPSAAPSEAPELVEIPKPPTASQLVVKSNSDKSAALKGFASSLGKSSSRTHTSAASKVTSGRTSEQQQQQASGIPSSQGFKSTSGPSSVHSKRTSSEHGAGSGGGGGSGGGSRSGSKGPSLSKLPTNYNESTAISGAAESGSPATAASGASAGGKTSQKSASSTGELKPPSSRSGSGAAAASEPEATEPEGTSGGGAGASSVYKSVGGAGGTSYKSIGAEGAAETSPESPGVGGSGVDAATSEPEASPTRAESADAATTSGGSRRSGRHGGASGGGGKKKKVTKFRYHKRITVRTHGKTSPSTIMDKVARKDKLTPSAIEEMDPQELIKRAGIKTAGNTHWRVRLRQTKRSTKNGKTVTETKVAYRDSEGNKRVRTSAQPDCKKCGKKLEECRCDSRSSS